MIRLRSQHRLQSNLLNSLFPRVLCVEQAKLVKVENSFLHFYDPFERLYGRGHEATYGVRSFYKNPRRTPRVIFIHSAENIKINQAAREMKILRALCAARGDKSRFVHLSRLFCFLNAFKYKSAGIPKGDSHKGAYYIIARRQKYLRIGNLRERWGRAL
jgi:hypothetical protein